MPWHSIPLEESLPSCERGDIYPISEIKLLEKQTNPPDYLTEAELITLMEKHGIGRNLILSQADIVPLKKSGKATSSELAHGLV